MLCRKMFKLMTVTLVVGWLLSACNASVSPPLNDQLLVSEPFSEQKKGYTIRYPQGWMYRWVDDGDAVHFFEEDKANQQNILPGPTVTIAVGPIEAFGEADKTADAQTMLKALLEGQSFKLNSKAGRREGWVEKIESLTVGGKDAAVATLRGTEDGTNFAARFVFVHTGDRGAIIFGVAQSEAWEIFNPTFEAMLDSMTFIEPSDE